MKLVITVVKATAVIALMGGGALLLGTIVLGKDRVADLTTAATDAARQSVDELIDQRKSLERKLADLEASYPARIAGLNGILRESEAHLAEIERDRATSLVVVEMCEKDIDTLSKPVPTYMASAAYQMGIRDTPVYSLNGLIFTPAEAARMVKHAEQTRVVHLARYNDLQDEHELVSAAIAAARSELEAIEAERIGFRAERDSIIRQLDRIEHNKRLIELAERNKSAISRHTGGKDSAPSLTRIREEIEHKRALQEEQLKELRNRPDAGSYERRARAKVERDMRAEN